MANVIGPNNRLPWNSYRIEPGDTCETHPERVSVYAMVGETDSYGSEIIHFCQECNDKRLAENSLKGPDYVTPGEVSYCEFCKNSFEGILGEKVKPFRPWDEPSMVRYGCVSCIREIQAGGIDESDNEPVYPQDSDLSPLDEDDDYWFTEPDPTAN